MVTLLEFFTKKPARISSARLPETTPVAKQRRTVSSTKIIAVSGVALALALIAACGSDSERACRVGADCASGICGDDGQCVVSELPQVDASQGETGPASGQDATSGTDASVDVNTNGCVPNKDGMITHDEAPVAAGLHATYKIATDVDVMTAGTGSGTSRVWDYSGALPGDQTVVVETLAPAGTWYDKDYSGATYATKLSSTSDLLGIFQDGADALHLSGVVSPSSGLQQTELTNSPAVDVLEFPLTVGKTWTSNVTVTGQAQGIFSTYTESYANKVDAAGVLKTPLGSFDVMRVQVVLTRTIGFLVTTIRTYAFVTECYGTIATITSDDNEANEEFTHVAEIRRLSP